MDTKLTVLELFGLRMKELRLAKGVSQEKLALESGIARSYLGGVERGERNIAVLNIIKIAEALNVEPYKLFEQPTPELIDSLKIKKLK